MTSYDQELDSESSVGTKDEKLLKEIRENFETDLTYWSDIRAEAATDMRFLAGDTWDPQERDNRGGSGTNQGRDNEKRLCLNFDELGQNVNQVVNNFLLNKPAVSIDPKGDGANDKTAEFRGDTIRQIEYRSNGTSAYAIAFTEMVRRSYGFFRIVRDFESPTSFNQQLSIKAIPNPDSVLPDSNGTEMDGSDWKRCFVLKNYTHAEFRREWPHAEITSFGEDLISQNPKWLQAKTVQVAEYWKVKETRKTLVSLDHPVIADEKQVTSLILEDYPNAKIVKDPLEKRKRWLEVDGVIVAAVTNQRPTITKRVCQYITNGLEILDEIEQSEDCPWIPIVPMYGEEMYVPGINGPQRILLSLIRLARDAQTAYSYVRTTQMEVIGQVPKAPYLMYAGQAAGFEDQWDKVNQVRIGYLQANATTEQVPEGTVLPLPQKTSYEPAIQAMEVSAEALRRAIQSAMGVSPLPTQALRRNEKSGVALKQIESTQQLGSYHFMDHAKLSIAQGGRIMNALLRSTYDTPRALGLRKADQTFETGPTHQMVQENGEYRMDPDAENGENIFDVGEHEVTVSTGPSYDSQRQAADDFVNTLVGAPGVTEAAIAQPGGTAAKLLSKAIRLKNLGPIGDEMAEDIDPSQDPNAAGQAAQKLQQATQVIQLAEQKIAELTKLADTEATKLKIATIEAQVKLTTDAADNKRAIEVAYIQAGAKIQDTGIKESAENTRQAHREHTAAHTKELDHRVAEKARQDQRADAVMERETGIAEADKDRSISVEQADADRKAAAEKQQAGNGTEK